MLNNVIINENLKTNQLINPNNDGIELLAHERNQNLNEEIMISIKDNYCCCKCFK